MALSLSPYVRPHQFCVAVVDGLRFRVSLHIIEISPLQGTKEEALFHDVGGGLWFLSALVKL